MLDTLKTSNLGTEMTGVELNQTGQEGSKGVIQSTQFGIVGTLKWIGLFRKQKLAQNIYLTELLKVLQFIMFSYQLVSVLPTFLLVVIAQHKYCMSGGNIHCTKEFSLPLSCFINKDRMMDLLKP